MAGDLDIGRCEKCDGPLPPRGRRGPRRRFCSDRCRQAAERDRRASFEGEPVPAPELPATPSEPVEAYLIGKAGPTDDQVLSAVTEAILLIGTFQRLGREARPQFAWRCRRVADAFDAALRKFFKVQV
jgi:hypothetical protein